MVLCGRTPKLRWVKPARLVRGRVRPGQPHDGRRRAPADPSTTRAPAHGIARPSHLAWLASVMVSAHDEPLCVERVRVPMSACPVPVQAFARTVPCPRGSLVLEEC